MMIVLDNGKEFETSENQDIQLLKLDIPKEYSHQRVVNIIYKNRNIPSMEVLKILSQNNYEHIDYNEIDEIMKWLRRINIEL